MAVEILLLEAITGCVGAKKFPRQRNRDVRILFRDAFIARERFVDPHDEFGNIVEPRELGVIHNKAEEFARGARRRGPSHNRGAPGSSKSLVQA